jgi:hypothetical protein
MVDSRNERQADLERREEAVAAREAALAKRMESAEAILGAADERDATGEARDAAADQREKDTDLSRFLAPDTGDEYGKDWPERRHAKTDREDAKDDRKASHDDRIALTEGDDVPPSDRT